MILRRRLALIVVAAALASPPATAQDLWQALAGGGHVVLMRHALAPGTGDPENFRLGDCATQRNLSAEGRAQARQLGVRFRSHGITAVRIFSSQWCRCRETAELLGLGPVRELPLLNSLFGQSSLAESQTLELRRFIAAIGPDQPTHILVTHQTNIRHLTGLNTPSAGMVVVRPTRDGLTVLGTLPGR